MEDREFRVKDVINLTLDRMKQEGIYFATKDDQGYASAKSLYKLDKEGYLEEKTIDKIVEEVISYMGDGAVYLVDAVNQWIEDGMAEGKLGYIDTLNMEFDDNEVIEGNLSIYNTFISHNLGTDIEPKEEEIAQEAEEVKPEKKKKTESKKVEGYDLSKYDTQTICADLESCIIRHLKEMYFKVPSVDVSTYDGGYVIEFSMEETDPNSNLIKKWLKEDFDLKDYEVSCQTFNHPNLTYGIRRTIYIMPKEDKKTEGKETKDVDKDNLIKAMELLGYYYNDIDSYDGYIKFNDIEGFNSWDEVQEYLELLVIEDPDISDQIENLLKESKKITERFFEGPEVKASELKIGDIYIDMSGNLNKVVDRPMPEKDLGTTRKQLTKMFMPNQQNIKGTKWETSKIRVASKEDMQKYPHIVDESKKVTETYHILGIKKDKQGNYSEEWIVAFDTKERCEKFRDDHEEEFKAKGYDSLSIASNEEYNDTDSYELDYSDGDAWEEGDSFEITDGNETYTITKRGSKWYDNKGQGYMGYLSPRDIVSYYNGFNIVTESKKVEAKVDDAVADIPDELLEPTPETKFTKKDWNIYYNRCKKDYTNVYNGDSTTKIAFLQNKAKSLGLDDLQFTEDSWKSDIDNIAKAYADSKVGNLNEARTHMKLRKGDTFVNENGVRVTVIEVDDRGNTTYKFSNGESYCTAMENAVAMLNQNNYKKVEEKRTLRENKRQRLNEENSKSKDLINSMVTAKDFDSDSPAGQIILRTQELFNVLSDRGYDLQVTFDNGESQSAIMLGNQGGSILITITNTNQPLRAFTSGNFEITDDSLQILNDVKEQITAL